MPVKEIPTRVTCLHCGARMKATIDTTRYEEDKDPAPAYARTRYTKTCGC